MERTQSHFGDQRLDVRFVQMQQAYLDKPHGCWTQVFAEWAELKAAYRFLK